MKVSNRSGFTIVEVCMAIAIISMVTAVGIYNFIKPVNQSKVVQATAEATVIEIAMTQYNADHPKNKLSAINITTLRNAKLLQYAPKFMQGKDTCTYAWETYNNGQFTTLEKHVVLKNCTFAADKIITAEGVF